MPISLPAIGLEEYRYYQRRIPSQRWFEGYMAEKLNPVANDSKYFDHHKDIGDKDSIKAVLPVSANTAFLGDGSYEEGEETQSIGSPVSRLISLYCRLDAVDGVVALGATSNHAY